MNTSNKPGITINPDFVSKVKNKKQYEENYDRIFGKKKKRGRPKKENKIPINLITRKVKMDMGLFINDNGVLQDKYGRQFEYYINNKNQRDIRCIKCGTNQQKKS